MPKLSLAKLERHLYSAADRLRQEGLDAATYKDYIFGMLFLKRCSKVEDIKDGKVNIFDLLLTGPQIDEAYRRSRVSGRDLLFTIRGTVVRMALPVACACRRELR
jgi:type I restriction enzyme M protein